MPPRSSQQSPTVVRVLRRQDQVGLAAMVAIALVTVGVSWGTRVGIGNRSVEFDQARPARVKFKIDLNRAEWPQLVLLPGIGETLARRIVESRQSDGPYQNHDDMRRIRGIGQKKFDRVRPYLRSLQ